MQLRFARAAGRTVAVGALATARLGFTQALLARTALAGTPQAAVSVPCSAAALASAIGGATSGETLSLAKFCVYKLTEGLPDIDTDLTINGNQSTIERSYAANAAGFTILTVDGEGGDVVLNGVSFRNGGGTEDLGGPILGPKAGSIRNDGDNTGNGGAIHNEGDLTVNGGTFTGNTATDEGGAIFNDDNLVVNGTVFTGNSSDDGGAIYNEDNARVTGSTFTGNTSLDDEYGGAIYADDDMTVTSSNFTRNSAEDGGYGGGIYIAEDVEGRRPAAASTRTARPMAAASTTTVRWRSSAAVSPGTPPWPMAAASSATGRRW